MVFAGRDLIWVFEQVCVSVHVHLLWGLYLRFDDLEDKKDIHEDFSVLQIPATIRC